MNEKMSPLEDIKFNGSEVDETAAAIEKISSDEDLRFFYNEMLADLKALEDMKSWTEVEPGALDRLQQAFMKSRDKFIEEAAARLHIDSDEAQKLAETVNARYQEFAREEQALSEAA